MKVLEAKVISTSAELLPLLSSYRQQGKSLGFVPTMGALHQGHMALVKRSIAENDISLCSIFVNPLQFNDPDDLKRYPSMPEKDILKLNEEGCDVIYMPLVEDVFPSGYQSPEIPLGSLDKVMEGVQRPGHFKGVAAVVNRFFEMIMPQRAYFGLKDFQQVAVIKEMVRKMGHKVQIVECATMRDPDGLAMSSRNLLLSDADRALAPFIYKTLCEAKNRLEGGSLGNIEQWAADKINVATGFVTEYFTVADAFTLQPIGELQPAREYVICTAVKAGKVRLIDNITFKTTA